MSLFADDNSSSSSNDNSSSSNNNINTNDTILVNGCQMALIAAVALRPSMSLPLN